VERERLGVLGPERHRPPLKISSSAKNCPKEFHRDALCEECGGCLESCCLCDVPNSDEEYEEIVAAREAISDEASIDELDFGEQVT
jgi:hypothetical protein